MAVCISTSGWAALARGLQFPAEGQRGCLGGVNAAVCPAASAWVGQSKPYIGGWSQNFREKQRQKAREHVCNWLLRSLCLCNSMICSQAAIVKTFLFSGICCKVFIPILYTKHFLGSICFLNSLKRYCIATLQVANNLPLIYSPIPQQALSEWTVLVPHRCSSRESKFI